MVNEENQSESQTACDPTFTRSQFVRKLVEKATIAGALVIVPSIVDSFVAPPAIAKTSGGNATTFQLKNNMPIA